MMTTKPELRTPPHLAAYHEAGHAVATYFRPLAGRTLEVSIRCAELHPDDAGAHTCEPVAPPSPSSPAVTETARALAVVALAGVEVDRRLTGNSLTCGSADYDAVRDLLFSAYLQPEIDETVAAVTRDEAQSQGLEAIAEGTSARVEEHFKQLLDELRGEACDLIDTKWAHVEAVARALLARGRLSGDATRAIIGAVEEQTHA